MPSWSDNNKTNYLRRDALVNHAVAVLILGGSVLIIGLGVRYLS